MDGYRRPSEGWQAISDEHALRLAVEKLRTGSNYVREAMQPLGGEYDLLNRASVVAEILDRLTVEAAERWGEMARRRLQLELLAGPPEASGEDRTGRVVPLRRAAP